MGSWQTFLVFPMKSYGSYDGQLEKPTGYSDLSDELVEARNGQSEKTREDSNLNLRRCRGILTIPKKSPGNPSMVNWRSRQRILIILRKFWRNGMAVKWRG